MRLRLFLLFFLFIRTIGAGHAQLLVDSLSVTQYVQDVLLGSGIQATNISFTGCLQQIGYLTGGGSAGLDIESGIILSTEHVRNVEVPSPNLGLWMESCTVSGDPALLNIANSVPPLIGQNFTVGSVNDLSILEFDFVPTGDTLRFNYIFGSDEYLEWINSTYNDIFAFLLSGPGITGPYAAPPGYPGGAVNIARLPGSNPPLPITISSVNNQLNAAYYVDNFDNSGISIDGYTVALEAWYPVQCGETYHIKLAIADGSDTALESVVILQEGSFSSNAVVDVALTINVGPPGAELLFEDCGEAVITFTRSPESDLSVQDQVVVTWGGTAQMGVDYNTMPDTIVFPPGVAEISFTLDAIEDNIAEGPELVNLDILNLAACNGSGLVSNFQFLISDEPQTLTVSGISTEACLGADVELIPEISGGYGNYTFDWSTGETSETILVSPVAPTTYFLTVSDTCGMQPASAQFQVDILVFEPLNAFINGGDLDLFCGEEVLVTASATGGNGPYDFTWLLDDGTVLSEGSDMVWYSSWLGEGQLIVQVSDACGFEEEAAINVTLDVPPLVVNVPAAFQAPCNQPFTVAASVSGGQGPYFYQWTLNGVTDWFQGSSVYSGNTSQPGTLELTVSDNCGLVTTEVIVIELISPPVILELVDEVSGTCNTPFTFIPAVSGGSGGFSYQWTQNGTMLGTQPQLVFSSSVSTEVSLTVTDVCSASASDVVQVTIDNPPLFVDLGPDADASCTDLTEVVAAVSGGSGGISYAWTVGGEAYGSGTSVEVQSLATVAVSVEVTDGCGITASDEMLIIIPDIPLTLQVAPDTSICLPGDASLWALAGGGEGGFTYQWLPSGSAGNELFLPGLTSSGVYEVIATDQCGRSISAEISVTVRPLIASFAAVQNSEYEYQFIAQPQPPCPDCTFIWSFGDGTTSTLPEVTHLFDGMGNYTVTHTAVNSIGCTDFTSFTVLAPPVIYIPNAFTPDGDGINDAFLAVGSGIREFELRIFDRWGEEVFYTDDIGVAWTGNHKENGEHYVQNDVYTYVARIKGYNSEAFEKRGSVTLIR
jgi:gliding motility-associated-like protein